MRCKCDLNIGWTSLKCPEHNERSLNRVHAPVITCTDRMLCAVNVKSLGEES